MSPATPIRVAGQDLPLRDLLTADGFDGKHAPTGVFVAAGAPIRREAGRVEVSVLDVAPLLFQLAGQPLPDDLEHPVRVDLLDPDWSAAHPARHVAASEMPGLAHGEEVGGVPDDTVTERLRALGYVR